MGWKKLIFGERMPDKADPQYKERYEKEVDAGKRFARWSRIDILAAKVQRWATGHERAFLILVFSLVVGCFVWNIIGIMRVVNAPTARQVSISERQQLLLDSLRGQDQSQSAMQETTRAASLVIQSTEQ